MAGRGGERTAAAAAAQCRVAGMICMVSPGFVFARGAAYVPVSRCSGDEGNAGIWTTDVSMEQCVVFEERGLKHTCNSG